MANKNHSRALVAGISAPLVLVVLSFAAARTFYSSQAQGVAPAQPRAVTAQAGSPAANPSQPFVVSSTSSARGLGRDIDRLIDESDFAGARWGLFVMSLRDGRVLYARNADKAMAPASNLKLYTTAVALDLLGADYRWRTSVYAESEPDKNGAIAGDLTLYGRGAPDLSSSAEQGAEGRSLEQSTLR